MEENVVLVERYDATAGHAAVPIVAAASLQGRLRGGIEWERFLQWDQQHGLRSVLRTPPVTQAPSAPEWSGAEDSLRCPVGGRSAPADDPAAALLSGRWLGMAADGDRFYDPLHLPRAASVGGGVHDGDGQHLSAATNGSR